MEDLFHLKQIRTRHEQAKTAVTRKTIVRRTRWISQKHVCSPLVHALFITLFMLHEQADKQATNKRRTRRTRHNEQADEQAT